MLTNPYYVLIDAVTSRGNPLVVENRPATTMRTGEAEKMRSPNRHLQKKKKKKKGKNKLKTSNQRWSMHPNRQSVPDLADTKH